MKAYTADVTRIADAVATVNDEASAHAAAATIAANNTELAALIKQIDAMSDTDKASAAMANMQELVAAQQKIAIAMSNMAMNNPAQMQIVADELGKMPELKTN
jgi:predicted porin